MEKFRKKYNNFVNEYSGFEIKCFKLGHDETLYKIKRDNEEELIKEKNKCLKNEAMKLIVNSDLENIVSDQ